MASAIYAGALIAFIVTLIERQAAEARGPVESVGRLFDRVFQIVAAAWSRPRMRATALVLAVLCAAGGTMLLYLSIEKTSRVMSRFPSAGMWRDISLAMSEKSFRLSEWRNAAGPW